MIKSVIKEISILILILMATALILIILFYDYTSNSKDVPPVVEAYVMSEDLKNELELDAENTSIQKYITTYRIDSSDLNLYAKQNSYNAGKVNPFTQYSSENVTQNSENVNVSGNGTTNEVPVSNSQNDTSGTFFNTVGK